MSRRPAGARPFRWLPLNAGPPLPCPEGVRRDQHHGRFVAGFGLAGDVADRFVQQDGDAFMLGLLRFPGELDLAGGIDPRAEFGNALAIDDDQALRDIAVGFAARADAALGHQLG